MKVALVTLCYNEIELLEFFFRHYDPIVDHYVIYDDQSDDGCREMFARHPKVEVRDRHANHMVDDIEHSEIKNHTVGELLKDYDCVLCVDFDEFLYHPNLLELLEQYHQRGVTLPQTAGYDMVDNHVPEGGLLTEQLRCGVRNPVYDKRSIVFRGAVPNYGTGCHSCQPDGCVVESQPEIKLLHYKYMSRESVEVESKRCKISARNEANKLGWTTLDGKWIRSRDYWPLVYERLYEQRELVVEMPKPDYGRCSFTMDSWPDKCWDQFDDILCEYIGRPVRALEIGSFEGKGAIGLATLLGSQAHIVCVDPYTEYEGNDLAGKIGEAEKRFRANVAASNVGHRIEHHKCTAGAYFFVDFESFDVVYVDGDHRAHAVIADAIRADELLKPGGMLIFDDYGWTIDQQAWRRPKPAIDFFISAFRDRYELIERDYRVFLRKLDEAI